MAAAPPAGGPPKAEEGHSVPPFGDIGSEAGDLFGGYDVGAISCSGKRNILGVDNTTALTVAMNGQDPTNLESKITLGALGLTLTGKLNDVRKENRGCGFGVKLGDKFIPGLKLGLQGAYAPQGAEKMAASVLPDAVYTPKCSLTGSLSGEYERDYLHTTFGLDFKGPATLKHSIAVGFAGFIGGVEIGYDISAKELVTKNIALGYTIPGVNIIAHAGVNNLKEVAMSVFKEFGDGLSAGVQLGYNIEEAAPSAAVGAKLGYSEAITLKGYGNVNRELGFSIQHKLKGGTGSITMSSVLDAKSINDMSLSCGVGLEIEL